MENVRTESGVNEVELSKASVALARRLGAKLGRADEAVLQQLRKLSERLSFEAVNRASSQQYDEGDLRLEVVRERARSALNRERYGQTHCSAGQTVIEIAPNGEYARCPMLLKKKVLLGNVRDLGPIKLSELGISDMACTLPCPTVMCVSRNVVRGKGDEEFWERMRVALPGKQRKRDHALEMSGVLVRWNMTNICNFTCPYCVAGKVVNSKQPELSDDDVLKATDKLCNQLPMMSLRLTGGEPSVRRSYVEMFDILYENIDKMGDIEVRTNFSFDTKTRQIVRPSVRNWKGKLFFHISCHVQDKNFKPWNYLDILNDPDCNYVLKFIVTDENVDHVRCVHDFFVNNGVSPSKIKIIGKFSTSFEDVSFSYKNEPLAVTKIRQLQ